MIHLADLMERFFLNQKQTYRKNTEGVNRNAGY